MMHGQKNIKLCSLIFVSEPELSL